MDDLKYLNLGGVRLNSHFLLGAVPRQRRAVRREAGIVNTEWFWLFQRASQWRSRAGDTSGSCDRRHRAVPSSANVRLAASVGHRYGAT